MNQSASTRRIHLFLLVALLSHGLLLGEIITLPQIADGPNWTTTVRIVSLFNSRDQVKFKAFRGDGTPWTDLGLSWRFGGTFEPDSNGEFDIGVDSESVMEVTSFRQSFSPDPNVDVVGFLVFDVNTDFFKISAFMTFHPGGERNSEVGVLASPVRTSALVPFDADTAIALVNPGFVTASISIRAIFTSVFGSSQEILLITLPPNGHRAFFLRDEIQSQGELFGYLDMSASSQFSAMALIFRSDGVTTSLPVE